MIDLHIHTYYSDGSKSVQEIFHYAKRAELRAIAITDHNSIKGFNEAYQESKDVNIEFIPGVEISCINGEGLLTEILGYMMNVQTEQFHALLRRAEKYYYNTFRRSLNRFEKSRNYHKGYHILRQLYHYFKSNYFVMTFARFLIFNSLGAVEAIKTIKALGGISILSHPRNREVRVVDNEEIIELAWQGLDGIEVYHPKHTAKDIKELLLLSRENNLLITGGSDYHGRNNEKSYVGCCNVEYNLLSQIKDRLINMKTGLNTH